MKKRLLAVQGPIQFIAGHIAMEWYKHIKHGAENFDTVLLMYDFLMPESMEAEFVKVITRLAAPFKWHSIIFISAVEMVAIMKGSYSKRVEKLHNAVGGTLFDEVIIGRDFCGDGSPLIINAFPFATRIVYGDSFGIVGNETITDHFDWRRPLRSVASRCKTSLLDLIYGKHKKFSFDSAVLSLPLDWSGTYLDNLELLVPNRDFVVDEIMNMSAAIHELSIYADLLLAPDENNYLFLLSNLSASGYLSLESEAELYIEIINQSAPQGATVLLKAHPRAPKFVLNMVAERIGNNFKTVLIDREEIASYPIELWTKLLENCTIVPIFSASAYQIKYIYGKDVILTLDDNRINRFIFHDRRHVMSKGNQSIVSCVENIDEWDGNSPLWKGC
jgi:hypothetical protein